MTFARIGKPESAHPAAAMFCDLGHALDSHGPQGTEGSMRRVFAWGDMVAAPAIDIASRTTSAPDAVALARLADAERKAAVTANDVFTICWTSGTEAAPKGVPRSHNEWLIVAPSIIEAASLQPHARLLNHSRW